MSRGAKWLTIIVLFLIWFVWYGDYQSADAHRLTRSDCHAYVQGTNAATYPLYQYRFNACKIKSIKHNKSHKPKCHNGVSVRAAIRCAFGSGSLYYEALSVATCESGLRTTAVNGRFVGIFQIGDAERRQHGWYVSGSPAFTQAKSARSLYNSRGWQPWYSSRGCWG